MRRVFRTIERVARSRANVLISGESGTGKELVAKAIHELGSNAAGPFVAINCAAIPEPLMESELFGHERGSFTDATERRIGKFEQASGGTLFLDEIAELPTGVQAKLLRALQERSIERVGGRESIAVDARFVAATNRDLPREVSAGRFREDLFYRLNVIRIRLPPLRERPGDVAPLAAALLARLAPGLGRPDPGLAATATAALEAEAWPGNVRELANVLERVLVLRPAGAGGPIDGDEIAAAIGGPPRAADGRPEERGKGTLGEKIVALERSEITAALRAARGVKARAAEALGISRPTLDKKIAELGIDLWREGPG
jgi:DNA-binding NtrC family response regulator